MSSHEIAQHTSTVGRRSFDGVLLAFVVAVMALLALGGTGVL
ncbi:MULTISPECIES: hypothetical protein [Solirubrobacterales]|nr:MULTISPECIES: hypothetical protein [Solirubrobacterales]